jgi:ABC-type dipeptide/oligopeptide/nickel transport system ATPase component
MQLAISALCSIVVADGRRCVWPLPSTRRTLLVIAHRINTIIDCDQLLVLSAGRIVEQGPPAVLASMPGGTFARLVRSVEARDSWAPPQT